MEIWVLVDKKFHNIIGTNAFQSEAAARKAASREGNMGYAVPQRLYAVDEACVDDWLKDDAAR